MQRWWSINFWRKSLALVAQRERLALLLWPFLSERERHEDDAAPLRRLERVVRTIEKDSEDFFGDEAAYDLWQTARNDQRVQEAAADLRTVRLQREGDRTAASTYVAPFGRVQLRPLKARMLADQLRNDIQWLHGPLTLPLLSTLFLFSGYLFNFIFFGHFGLPVGRYFGLSDYLAASIDGIVTLTISLIFALILQWLVRNTVRWQTLQHRLGRGLQHTVFGLLLVATIALFMLLQNADDPTQQRITYIYFFGLASIVVGTPLVNSYSRRPARDAMLVGFTGIYLLVTWYTAETRYLNIEQRTPLSVVTFAAAPDSPTPLRIVAGNSLYLFMMDEQRELIAVPVEQILSVRYPVRDLGADAESRQ